MSTHSHRLPPITVHFTPQARKGKNLICSAIISHSHWQMSPVKGPMITWFCWETRQLCALIFRWLRSKFSFWRLIFFFIYKNRNSALHSVITHLSVNVGINIATHTNIFSFTHLDSCLKPPGIKVSRSLEICELKALRTQPLSSRQVWLKSNSKKSFGVK